MYLIVGLGNPGSEYSTTRHNIGFRVIESWSRCLGVRLRSHRFQSRNARTRFQNQEIMLLCPTTFMNLSGKSVRACADFYDLDPAQILAIHDDLDLPPGRVKVVGHGGAGGHKGVSSLIRHLESIHFPRIKVGIGRPRYGEAIEDYVLSPVYGDEKDLMEKATHLAIRACELFVSEGVESAMNQINCQNLGEKEERS